MGHHPGRPESQHQAEEHANAFEGEGVGAGEERVGGGQGKQPDDHRDQPAGGADGFRMDARHLNAAGGDLVESHFHQANDEPGDQENKHHDHQPRQGGDNRQGEIADHAQRPVTQRFTPHPCPGKQAEGPAQPEITGQHADENDQHSIESNFNIAEIAPPVLRDGAAFFKDPQQEKAPHPPPGAEGAVVKQRQQQPSGQRFAG
ncbi:Uncharacterised protein [Klebsiella variicola]|nr:Uncharacterised protein [Klebsiella variicola]